MEFNPISKFSAANSPSLAEAIWVIVMRGMEKLENSFLPLMKHYNFLTFKGTEAHSLVCSEAFWICLNAISEGIY